MQILCQIFVAAAGRRRPVLTSLSLEVSLYFGGLYDVFFWVLQIAIFVYKGESIMLNNKQHKPH